MDYTTYTHEQQAHLEAINRRLRSLEEKLHKDMLEIWRHLTQAIENGMEVYNTFVVDGQILLAPDMDNVPQDVLDRIEKHSGYSVNFYSEAMNESEIIKDYEYQSKFDWRYFKYPEEYPVDYIPTCRTFSYLIEHCLIHDEFTIEDLMYLKPDDIFSYIEICL